jgi:tripartite-type tricarboxylate transporter receptor subunit TctC
MNSNRGWLAGSLVAGCLTALVSTAVWSAETSEAWPSKRITYIVPFAPGGNTDTLARIIAEKLGAALGQPVVIDNKPGAGGNIGSDFVAKAKPDGYTILGGTISSHAINPSIYAKMPYDATKDFQPITLIATSPLVLVVNANSPYKSVKDLLDAAKAQPGTLTFASAGTGTSPHLAGELLKSVAHVDVTHVPYKGSGPAVTDLIAGHVQFMFDTTLIVGGHIKAGKLRPLAVTSSKRTKSLPDVPTLAEAGVPGYEIGSWQAVFAPAGTPKPIVQKLNSEIVRVLNMPDVQERLAGLGMDAVAGTPEQLGEFQKAEVVKWAKVVREAKITPE